MVRTLLVRPLRPAGGHERQLPANQLLGAHLHGLASLGLHYHRCSAVAQNKSTCTCNGAAAATQRAEIRHQIRRLSHHPSIVLWDAVNEAGGFGVSAARIFRLATDSFSPPRCFDFSHCRTYRDSCLRRL